MIKLEMLQVFATVAELGNIKDAGQKLGRTPSAISMALKSLEQTLGAPLFETDRKNTLTPLGTHTFEIARTQLRSFARACGSIEAFANNGTGRLTVASVPSVAAHVIPAVLGPFIAARPDISFELRDADSAAVEDLVEHDAVDLGIAGKPRGRGPLKFELLFEDRFVLICPVQDELAQFEGAIEWRAIAARNLIENGASQAITNPAYQAIAARARLMVRNNTSLIGLVRAGLGVTLLPETAAKALPGGLIARPLADRAVTRQVGLITRLNDYVTPLATTFMQELRAALG